MSVTTTSAGTPVPAGRRGGGMFVNLSVQFKILLAGVLGVMMAVLIGSLALIALGQARDAARQIYTSNVRNVELVGTLQGVVGAARTDLANHLISRDDASMD